MRYNNFQDFMWYNVELIDKKLFNFMLWRTAKKLGISCKLWKLRGLPTCKEHGFHAQSWINGKCRKCEDEKYENIKM